MSEQDGFMVANRHRVTKEVWKAFLDQVGGHPGAFGDDVTEPMAAPQDLGDTFEQVWHDANEHHECPDWCDDCDQWEEPMSCARCNGSGCSPRTALGAYDPCGWCAGDGRKHEPYTPTGTWRHRAHAPEGSEPRWTDDGRPRSLDHLDSYRSINDPERGESEAQG